MPQQVKIDKVVLTGKCSEAFDAWYSPEEYQLNLFTFKLLPIALRLGVYMEFLESLIEDESGYRELVIDGIKLANGVYNTEHDDK